MRTRILFRVLIIHQLLFLRGKSTRFWCKNHEYSIYQHLSIYYKCINISKDTRCLFHQMKHLIQESFSFIQYWTLFIWTSISYDGNPYSFNIKTKPQWVSNFIESKLNRFFVLRLYMLNKRPLYKICVELEKTILRPSSEDMLRKILKFRL